ncbi:glycosyltransferase family 2 protein [candidate division KSB1 bacterium]|nr:glycosyltransferase family 2 protein [candidate division KSB1 bacterium]RQW01094.1 MAG: glycosyltransferase family 2 protein [candidate division KSB1 bacterium]
MSVLASVIVPVYNEEKYIAQCISSIVDQDIPKDQLEVLFVDGRSRDNTRQIIQSFAQKYPFILLLDNPARIVPTAMNIGIKAARGTYVVRMDAHSTYERSYVSRCVDLLQHDQADGVGGAMRARGFTYTSRAIAIAFQSIFGLGGGKFHNEKFEGYTDTVYLGAYKKQLLLDIGLYNENLVRNQDIELNSRIIRQGGTLYCSANIVSYYTNRDSLKKLWTQYFRTGEWNLYTSRVNKNALSLRHFVPFLFVSFLLGFAILSLFSSKIVPLLLLTIAVYLLCCIVFSVAAGLNYGLRFIPILPAVFATLHVSYGVGGLAALFRWFRGIYN